MISAKRWRPGRLAKNTMVLGTGMALRGLAQAFVFLIVVRTLGSEGYGAFSAALAVAGVWVNFCGLGGHVLLVRDVARDSSIFSSSWGLTLAALAVGIVPVILFYGVSARLLLSKVPSVLVVSLGLGELLFWPLANAASFAYRGFERMGRSARLFVAPVVARLAAAVVLGLVVLWNPLTDRLILWGWLYAAGSLSAAVYAAYRVTRDLGPPSWPGRRALLPYISNGLPFSFWGGANKLYIDADKFLLARMASLEVTGTYSAGYRFVDLALLPLHALLDAAAPRLFKAGAESMRSALRAIVPLLWPSFAYALTVGAAISLAAPLIPHFLGSDYAGAVPATQWLAWLPLAGLPRQLLNYTVIAGDAQRLGMMTAGAGALVNVALTIWWIPLWSWRGAAAATYASELFMTLMLAAFLLGKTYGISRHSSIQNDR
ncbi:oligosaccharide flippase family protein [Desulfosoma caldarium]|uniref:O-antigen/teichoic acid export membrane protein n=1 Tax=Desulfosoma caldarium TaxID=610254 RepID=A0A3N1UHP8_9BACT|nr:oligosaccharide flippase family protein [Desulfosoma caldarium]ROQ90784.1 O-antigen/teichoic acid export membrane protein [Desulfosoma caldarium]